MCLKTKFHNLFKFSNRLSIDRTIEWNLNEIFMFIKFQDQVKQATLLESFTVNVIRFFFYDEMANIIFDIVVLFQQKKFV